MDFRKMLRVTDVLSPWSGMDKIPIEILNRASDRGTKVHQEIQSSIAGLGAFPDSVTFGYLHSWTRWLNGRELVTKFIEHRFNDEELGITGQVDCIGQLDGILTLIDWKTSKTVNRVWAPQISAYTYLAKKAGCEVERALVVQLQKDGEIAKEIEIQDCFDVFLGCLKAYKYFKGV